MRGASGGAFVEGPVRFLGAQFAVPPVAVTLGAGVETPVVTLRADTIYHNRQSTAQLQIDRFTVACDGTKTVNFKVYKNATLTAPRWQRVNSSTSAASFDSNATGFSIGSGSVVYAFSVGKTANATESVTDLALFMQSGDTLTITATSANASDVSASIIWVEDV
jgi:phosphotransferase system HPr-like phosphotransfer protein